MENNIVIENCNCIKHAEILLKRNQLNIKFGVNGTGKSTIGQAIKLSLGNDAQNELMRLLPYGASQDTERPSVAGLDGYNNVLVFDESYASQFIMEESTLFENSFQVFLKSDKCERIANEIDKMLEELLDTFQNQEDFQDIRNAISHATEIIKINSSGSISHAGGLGELIQGNGYGFEKHPDLQPYEAYYDSGDFSKVSKWASWRREGSKQLNGSLNCPFCAIEMDMPLIEKQNESIDAVFKSAALKTANELVTFFEEITSRNIAVPTAIERIKKNLGDSTKTAEVEADLLKLGIETKYLFGKFDDIMNFKPVNVGKDKLNDLTATLEKMKIQEEQIACFYGTERMHTITSEINQQIEVLVEKTGVLKGLFNQYERSLTDLIRYPQNNHPPRSLAPTVR